MTRSQTVASKPSSAATPKPVALSGVRTHAAHRNIAILVGRLARPAEERTLPSGDRVATLEVLVEGVDGQRSETVPVSWFNPSTDIVVLAAGTELVIVGSVRRRFFRSGGLTQSRTDLTAVHVLDLSRRAAVKRVLEAAAAEVAALLTAPSERVMRP